MNILKSIYKNEIKIKEISILKAFFILAMMTIVLKISAFISPLIAFIINGDDASVGVVMIITMVFVSILYIILIVYIAKKYTNREVIVNKSGMKITKKHFLYVAFIIIGYVLIRDGSISDILFQFEGPVSDEDIDFVINGSTDLEMSLLMIMSFLKSLILAPVFEEILFRGIIFNGLLNKYKGNFKKAMIYSSLLFATVHLNIPQGVNSFIGGIILGFIYYYTKSMKLIIFAHFANNFIAFIPTPTSIISKVMWIVMGSYLIVKGVRFILDNAKDNGLLHKEEIVNIK